MAKTWPSDRKASFVGTGSSPESCIRWMCRSIEAMQWLGLPLSARELVQIFDEKASPASVISHTRRLAKLGAIEIVETHRVHGTGVVSYGLAMRRWGDGH